MYSGSDSSSGFPTPWNLNPVAYQNMDTSQVDWAALAQRWIQMKETYPSEQMPPAPPPPPLNLPVLTPSYEGGEAPMDVDVQDNMGIEPPPAPTMTPSQWNSQGSWSNDVSWNQWNVPSAGWGWSGSKPSVPNIPPAPTPYGSFQSGDAPYSGYTSTPSTTFNPGYWTRAGEAAASAAILQPEGVPPPHKPMRENPVKSPARKPSPIKQFHHPVAPETVPPIVHHQEHMDMPALDAAKRRQLPAWIREGLEKMEREKQKQLERERQLKEKEERKSNTKWDDNSDPSRSKFDSDGEDSNASEAEAEGSSKVKIVAEVTKERDEEHEQVKDSPAALRSPPRLQRSHEQLLQEVMLNVRRALTEILLEVTNEEILSVSQEEMARYKASKQATRGGTVAKSQALSTLGGGLGLGIYGDSSGSESGNDSEDDQTPINDKYISDIQLQENIRRRKVEFERTSRDIEALLALAEKQQAERAQKARARQGVATAAGSTPSPSPPPPSPALPPARADKNAISEGKEEDFTPPRDEKQYLSRQHTISESDKSRRDDENVTHAESLKYDRTDDKLIKREKSHSRWSDKSGKDEKYIKSEGSSRSDRSSRDDRSYRDEKVSRSDKTQDRKSILEDIKEEKVIPKSNREENTSRDRKSAKENSSSKDVRLSKSKITVDLKNTSPKEYRRVDSNGNSQKENKDKESKINKYVKIKEEYSPKKSNRDEKSETSSSDEESSDSDSSSKDSESKSDSSESSSGSTSDEEKRSRQSGRESSNDSYKKKSSRQNENDGTLEYKSRKKHVDSEDRIDKNNFDVESEKSSKHKYPDRLNDRGSTLNNYDQSREHSSSKRKHSEKSKSRSRSYDRSNYYRSRSRDRSTREKDYYRKDIERTDDKSRHRNSSYERHREKTKDRSRSFEKSRDRSRGRSSDRYRERSKEYRDRRRDSRSRSRSKYYRSHRY